MIKKPLCALCDGDKIVYTLNMFIAKASSTLVCYERIYPDGKIKPPDSNDLEQIQFVLYHEGILSRPYPVF